MAMDKTTPILIVDDYNLPMCRKAVTDYREREGITEEIVPIDDAGVYWRKATESVESGARNLLTSAEAAT